jgi:hypothetical protein
VAGGAVDGVTLDATRYDRDEPGLGSGAISMAVMDIQYVTDSEGNPTSVIVPIDLWREIAAERETAYLLRSETMKQRLLEARQRREGIPFDEVREKLGV